MLSTHELRAILARPYFRRLYTTRVVSQASDGVLQVGLAAYVFFSPQQQATATKVAAAFAVLLLPYSLVGPFAGVLLDRWRRRQVLVHANLVRTLLVLGLSALVVTGRDGVAFFGVALVALSVNRFFLATLSTALPHVVAHRQLITANALSTTSGTVAAFLGGGVGYGLRRLFGIGSTGSACILAVAAGVYLCSAIVATSMGRDLLGPDHRPGKAAGDELRRVARGLRDGARHIWRRRRGRLALGVISAHRFLYGVSVLMTLLLYRNYFHPEQVRAGLAGLALVFAASGVGYFLAAFATPAATARVTKATWITVLLCGAGVAEVALGVPFRPAPLVAAGFCLGLSAQGTKISVDTLIQESTDDRYRGWVFSCYDMLYNVAFVAAAALAAAVLPPDGKSYTVVTLIGCGYLFTALLYRLASRPERAFGPRTQADNRHSSMSASPHDAETHSR